MGPNANGASISVFVGGVLSTRSAWVIGLPSLVAWVRAGRKLIPSPRSAPSSRAARATLRSPQACGSMRSQPCALELRLGSPERVGAAALDFTGTAAGIAASDPRPFGLRVGPSGRSGDAASVNVAEKISQQSVQSGSARRISLVKSRAVIRRSKRGSKPGANCQSLWPGLAKSYQLRCLRRIKWTAPIGGPT